MKILIVESNFFNRRLLQEILSPYGDCEFAFNYEEVLLAYKEAIKVKDLYQLIFLDTIDSENEPKTMLKEIRTIEKENHIEDNEAVKILLTINPEVNQSTQTAFHDDCEAYLIKPFDKHKILDQLIELGLLQ